MTLLKLKCQQNYWQNGENYLYIYAEKWRWYYIGKPFQAFFKSLKFRFIALRVNGSDSPSKFECPVAQLRRLSVLSIWTVNNDPYLWGIPDKYCIFAGKLSQFNYVRSFQNYWASWIHNSLRKGFLAFLYKRMGSLDDFPTSIYVSCDASIYFNNHKKALVHCDFLKIVLKPGY